MIGLFMRLAVLSAAFSMVVLTAACAKDEAPETKGIADPLVFKTTKETYLTGPEFCSFYSKITQNETGLRVSVPKDYDHPELGSLSIYAYTTKPFDASLPSYIYFDGGPGQNTHGLMFDFFGTTMNEIRFDQRGLGCSAPLTWEEYTDATLYSSRNNIRDADEIRKAYGIAKWTVYGVSYGTVPATMYGSKFASVTTSVVLEGVVGDTAMLGDATYKVGKLNLVLALLTPAQRDGFAKLIQEQDESGDRTADSGAFRALMMQYFYIDKGMSKFAEKVNAYVAADGTILRAKLADLRTRMNNRAREYPRAQQPGAVDENILTIIYCKDLSARETNMQSVHYSGTGFYAYTRDPKYVDQECSDAGVSRSQEEPFAPKDYKTPVNVYYFQGAHDGATIARGALVNWQNVPQGKSFFLMAEKGGHNPNLTRLESEDASIKLNQNTLFAHAIHGDDIAQLDLVAINQAQAPDQAWELYLSPAEAVNIADKFEGISRWHY